MNYQYWDLKVYLKVKKRFGHAHRQQICIMLGMKIIQKIVKSTLKLQELCITFKKVLIDRAAAARELQVYLFP